MEHDSSFNKQLRKEITARAVMNKKIETLKADIDENNIETYDVDNEINRICKAMRRRKQEHQKQGELSSRFNELKKIKTDLKNKIEALNQIISHIE